MKPTVEELSELLIRHKFISRPIRRIPFNGKYIPVEGASAEVYGDEAVLYVVMRDARDRKLCESFLEQKGISVNKAFNPRSPVCAISVRYFKGWHWDE